LETSAVYLKGDDPSTLRGDSFINHALHWVWNLLEPRVIMKRTIPGFTRVLKEMGGLPFLKVMI
jgi:hypothetical protein